MSEKLYKMVGTSVKKGEKKLRLASCTAAERQKILEKDGHTEIRLFDLPSPMTAAQAEEWLKQQGDAVPEHKPKAAAQPKERAAKPATNQRGKGKQDTREVDFWGTDWNAPDREVSEEVEAKAKEIQKTDWLSFMPWDEVSPAVRNEYRVKAEIALGIATLAKEGEPA